MIMKTKEYQNVVKSIRDICGFDFLEKKKRADYVEARSVFYKILSMSGVITQRTSDLILENEGVFFDRVAIRHSLINFDMYYDSSKFVRDLYHQLNGYSDLSRTKTKLEVFLSEVDIDRHKELLKIVEAKVNEWNDTPEHRLKHFFTN